jgi:pyocin large subunit-like protein
MRLSVLGLLLWLACDAQAVQLLEAPSVGLTTSNAVIRWVTDVACGTNVRVEPAGAQVTVTEGKKPGTHHSVTISGLQPTTRYTITLGTARVWLATNVFIITGSSQSTSGVHETHSAEPTVILSKAPTARKTWGNYVTLPDHFARHGVDFHAKDPEDYARMAWEFRQRAIAEGLPAKLDEERVLRVYDPVSGAFAAYNPNGTTKTFFKPGSRDYFERQPGRLVNLKTWKSN